MLFRSYDLDRKTRQKSAAAQDRKFSRSGSLFGLFDDRVEVGRLRVNREVLKDRVAVLALLKMLVLFEGQFAFSVYE